MVEERLCRIKGRIISESMEGKPFLSHEVPKCQGVREMK